jgi:hypothetical protein
MVRDRINCNHHDIILIACDVKLIDPVIHARGGSSPIETHNLLAKRLMVVHPIFL